jgi:CheY-like chemotaxis protein
MHRAPIGAERGGAESTLVARQRPSQPPRPSRNSHHYCRSLDILQLAASSFSVADRSPGPPIAYVGNHVEGPMTTILLVDDAASIRELMATFLDEEGYQVETTDRAEDALTRLDVSVPDLLILDGRLPGMSGWECLDLLRTADHAVKLPVLMLTAAVDDLQRVAWAPDDCTTFLQKPFDLDALLEAIEGVITTCNREPLAV